jgi:shikimate kinase
MPPASDAAGLDAGGRHVVLVGLMGTGKTSVGRRVAQCLGRPFLDSDAQVEARTGRTVREIFESDGEAVFRELEARALADALGRSDLSVIAAAGGVVLDPANRERLRTLATAVWLRADPALLACRITSGDHRPLLDDNSLTMLQRMDEERKALYDEVAQGRVIDVGSSSIEDAVDAVLELVS